MMETLTTSQLADLMALCEEWCEIATSVRPANLPRAERGICLAYKEAGLPEPTSIKWVASPAQGAVEVRQMRKTSFALMVGPLLRWAVQKALTEMVAEVHGEVSGVVGDLSLRVRQVAESVFQPAVADVPFIATASDLGGGQYDAGLGFYADVCERVLGLPSRLEGLREVARSGGVYWPSGNSVVIAERPVRLHRQDGRLHCTDGPAVEWPDGYSIFALNGSVVPRQVVESPESLSAKAVAYERRQVVRELMIERMGLTLLMQRAEQERILGVVDFEGTRGHPDYRRLCRMFFREGGEALVALECTDATARPDGSRETYWIRVPPWTLSCLDAVAWTFDVTAEQYLRMALET